jgi:hypothetical protein
VLQAARDVVEKENARVGAVVVVEAKPKPKPKSKKCGSCDRNWKILKCELQDCCKCKKTFHSTCMPLWFGRDAATQKTDNWYEFSAGVRETKGQLWSNSPVPEHYLNAEMPEQLFDSDYQVRFDFCFVCSCLQGMNISFVESDQYVRSTYMSGTQTKPTCAVSLNFPEEQPAATPEPAKPKSKAAVLTELYGKLTTAKANKDQQGQDSAQQAIRALQGPAAPTRLSDPDQIAVAQRKLASMRKSLSASERS